MRQGMDFVGKDGLSGLPFNDPRRRGQRRWNEPTWPPYAPNPYQQPDPMPAGADLFPGMVQDRDQLSRLWTHVAQVLSDGIRANALRGEDGQQPSPAGLPPVSEWAGADGRLESEMGEDMGQGGGARDPSSVPQLPDPSTRNSSSLPASEIARFAFQAGFRGEALATMVAIALSESNGNPRAHNPRGRDDSYGLWQINMFESLGPQRRRAWGLQSDEELWDPATNARAAFSLVQGRGGTFQDWSDFNNGRYLRYWQVASQAAAAVEGAVGGVR